MEEKSVFQMYREMCYRGPVLLAAVKKDGALTGDWQARWYRSSDAVDAKNPAIVVEADTPEFAVRRLHKLVMEVDKV